MTIYNSKTIDEWGSKFIHHQPVELNTNSGREHVYASVRNTPYLLLEVNQSEVEGSGLSADKGDKEGSFAEQVRKGFELAMLAMAGNIRTAGKYEERQAYMGQHPISGDRDKHYIWCGSQGFSDSHLYLIRAFFSDKMSGIVPAASITLHHVQEQDMPLGNYRVYLEVVDAFDLTYFAGGMTNYSGSGGEAYKEARSFTALLSFFCGVKVNKVYHPRDPFNWAMVDKAVMDAQEESQL